MARVDSKGAPPRPVDFGDTLEYLAQYKQPLMEGFAQYVIRQGFGAVGPPRYMNGKMVTETWQGTGRRLFGPQFLDVLKAELAKQSEANAESNDSRQSMIA